MAAGARLSTAPLPRFSALGLAAAAEARSVRVLAFGDSLTAGYGLPPEETFPARLEARLRADGVAAQIIDGGVSGDTTAGGLARLDWSLGDKPDYVLRGARRQ